MKGVDYTKALARERENFQNTILKDREHTSKRLADEEARHSEVQKKQAEVFMRDKSKLEKDYQANLDSIQEKTNELMDGEKENFHKINRDELDRFTKQRENLRKEFDEKMNHISNSYEKARLNDKEFNQTINKEKDSRYQQNVSRLTKDKDEKLAEYAKKFEGSGAANRDQMNLEKSQLTRAHQDQLKSIYQEEAGKRFQLKEGLQQDLERTKAAYEAEKELNQEYVKTKVGKVSSNFNARAEKMTNDYAKKNQEFLETQKQQDYKISKQHQGEVSNLRSNFERELRNIDIDKRRRDNGQGEFAEVIQRQQGLKDDIVFTDKINRLKENLSDARTSYDNRAIRERESYKDTLQTEASAAVGRQERKEKQLVAEKIVEVARHKEKAARVLKNQMASQQADRIRHQEHLMQERSQASTQIHKLKENFNQSLQDLQLKNEKFMSELKELNNNEKTQFIINANQARNEEILELRRNFGKLVDSTVNNYETQLKHLGRENLKLKQDLDLKVSTVLEDADNRIRLQTELYNQKRIADQKSYQAAIDARNADFQTKILELSDSFQTKMDNQGQLNVIKNKQLVNSYEAKLKIKDAELAKDLNEKQALHAAEIKTIKSTMEQEKAQIISQYENRLNQTNLAHKQQIDQLNEYKRIS
jgi:hypothetical protein